MYLRNRENILKKELARLLYAKSCKLRLSSSSDNTLEAFLHILPLSRHWRLLLLIEKMSPHFFKRSGFFNKTGDGFNIPPRCGGAEETAKQFLRMLKSLEFMKDRKRFVLNH